jgi:poly(3-hydroxyalkanoate) synthetase
MCRVSKDHTYRISNSEANNVFNMIKSHKTYTKSRVGQYRPPEKSEDKDQVPWRSKHPLLTGHTHREALDEIRYMELPVVIASKRQSNKEYETNYSTRK